MDNTHRHGECLIGCLGFVDGVGGVVGVVWGDDNNNFVANTRMSHALEGVAQEWSVRNGHVGFGDCGLQSCALPGCDDDAG